MVQLWVNLPARDKMAQARYQPIGDAQIPSVELSGGRGRARIIAGDLDGTRGPATTFTPINLWDVKLAADTEVTLPVPEGHNTMVAVLSGQIMADGRRVGEAEIARFGIEGDGVTIRAEGDALLLVLTGEPIDEPVVGYGPFVMTSEAGIREAIEDFNAGRFGQVARG
jgi:hypothetical protein